MPLKVGPESPFAYIPNTADDTVSVIDTVTNTVVSTVVKVGSGLHDAGPELRGVAAFPGGNVYVTNPSDDSVSVIDTATQAVLANVTAGNQPFGVAVTPDGSQVYVGLVGDQAVAVLDTANNYQVGTILELSHPPSGLAAAPDGSQVWVAAGSEISQIWPGTKPVLGPAIQGIGIGQATGLAVSAFSTMLWVADSVNGAVWAIDAATRELSAIYQVGASPWGVAVTPDPDQPTVYVTNSQDATVSVITPGVSPQDTPVPTVRLPGTNPTAVSVTPDGNYVYVTGASADQASTAVWVIATATNEVVRTLEVGGNTGFGTSALGQFIAVPQFEILRDPFRP